jgi:hypothetical protein
MVESSPGANSYEDFFGSNYSGDLGGQYNTNESDSTMYFTRSTGGKFDNSGYTNASLYATVFYTA